VLLFVMGLFLSSNSSWQSHTLEALQYDPKVRDQLFTLLAFVTWDDALTKKDFNLEVSIGKVSGEEMTFGFAGSPSIHCDRTTLIRRKSSGSAQVCYKLES